MPSNNIVLQLKDFLLGLRDQYGFIIDVGRLEDSLACIHDITDVEEVVYRLQSMICKDEEQISIFRSAFGQTFLGSYVDLLATAPGKAGLQDAHRKLSSFQASVVSLSDNISATEKHIQSLKGQIAEEEKQFDSTHGDLRQKAEQLKEEIKSFSPKELAKQNPRIERQLNRMLDKARTSFVTAKESIQRRDPSATNADDSELDSIIAVPMASYSLRKIILQLLNEATQQDLQYARDVAPVVKSFSMLANLCDNIIGKNGYKELKEKQLALEACENQKRYARSHIIDLENEIKWRQEMNKLSQTRLEAARAKADEQLQKIEQIQMHNELVIKQQSQHHRDIFTAINAKAVQTTAEQAELLSEPIAQLSPEQMQQVATYIRTNARAFRQTLRRTAATPTKRRIDMRATMTQATKTGGEPMMIKYKKPIKSHAKIVCLVDISGSCRQAASVALYFMALMDEAFPGGCHKFAFVNHLVLVDQYFHSQSTSAAVNAVNDKVPSRGIYSDYGRTLHQLKEEYSSLIGKETTLIILGDARNNRNASREEDVRYFCTRARKVWWLNPDPPQKWGKGDSATKEYQRAGVDMRHIANVGDLLNFLSSASQ